MGKMDSWEQKLEAQITRMEGRIMLQLWKAGSGGHDKVSKA